MGKNRNNNAPVVKVTTAKPSKEDKKPKETMFVSGPIQIPAEFDFSNEEDFMARFKGQKTGKDVRLVYADYIEWRKKNK